MHPRVQRNDYPELLTSWVKSLRDSIATQYKVSKDHCLYDFKLKDVESDIFPDPNTIELNV